MSAPTRTLKEFSRQSQRAFLLQTIKANGGDRGKAATALKISEATLYRILARPEATSEATPTATAPAPTHEPQSPILALYRDWLRCSPEEREQFLADIGAIVR